MLEVAVGIQTKAFLHFLDMALGSVHEAEYCSLLSKDVDYINEEIFKDLSERIKYGKKQNLSILLNQLESNANAFSISANETIHIRS